MDVYGRHNRPPTLPEHDRIMIFPSSFFRVCPLSISRGGAWGRGRLFDPTDQTDQTKRTKQTKRTNPARKFAWPAPPHDNRLPPAGPRPDVCRRRRPPSSLRPLGPRPRWPPGHLPSPLATAHRSPITDHRPAPPATLPKSHIPVMFRQPAPSMVAANW